MYQVQKNSVLTISNLNQQGYKNLIYAEFINIKTGIQTESIII